MLAMRYKIIDYRPTFHDSELVVDRIMSVDQSNVNQSSNDYAATIIKRPFIPFCGLIPFQTQVSSTVIIRGRVPRFAERFIFNLMVSEDNTIDEYTIDNCDIALHFCPLIDIEEEVVIKNSRIKNHWGIEEKQKRNFPFARNEWFEIAFVVQPSYFTIFVNGMVFGLFLHRIPFQFINVLTIDGDVEVESIIYCKSYKNGMIEVNNNYIDKVRDEDKTEDRIKGDDRIKSQDKIRAKDFKREMKVRKAIEPKPKPKPKRNRDNATQTLAPRIESRTEITHYYGSEHSIEENMVLSQKTIYNPPTPFSYSFSGGLKTGMLIIINGQVKRGAKQFDLRFQKGTCKANADIAMELSVRFGNNDVMRKTRYNDEWYHRQNDGKFPFENGKINFQLKIRIEANRFIIYFNDEFFADYISTIIDLIDIDVIEIEGDINIHYVKIDACEIN